MPSPAADWKYCGSHLRSLPERPPQKFSRRGGDLREVRFERKMPRLQELNRGVGVVSQECLGARRNEIWINLPLGRGRREKPVGLGSAPGALSSPTGLANCYHCDDDSKAELDLWPAHW